MTTKNKTTMTKEGFEIKVSKAIDDGFQHDYDKVDNLVPVFKKDEVVSDIIFFMEEYAQSLLSEKWISVEERLPEVDNSKSDFGERVQCLVVYGGVVWIGYYSNFGRPHWSISHINSSESLRVTAWQPLPSPPTK